MICGLLTTRAQRCAPSIIGSLPQHIALAASATAAFRGARRREGAEIDSFVATAAKLPYEAGPRRAASFAALPRRRKDRRRPAQAPPVKRPAKKKTVETMPAAAKSKPKSVRKRSKHRMSVDYPRDVENVAPAATFKAKAAPRSPILERVASAVEKVFSPQKKVPATTPTPAPTPVPEATTTPARLPEVTITSADAAAPMAPAGPSPAKVADAIPARGRERCACFFW